MNCDRRNPPALSGPDWHSPLASDQDSGLEDFQRVAGRGDCHAVSQPCQCRARAARIECRRQPYFFNFCIF